MLRQHLVMLNATQAPSRRTPFPVECARDTSHGQMPEWLVMTAVCGTTRPVLSCVLLIMTY